MFTFHVEAQARKKKIAKAQIHLKDLRAQTRGSATRCGQSWTFKMSCLANIDGHVQSCRACIICFFPIILISTYCSHPPYCIRSHSRFIILMTLRAKYSLKNDPLMDLGGGAAWTWLQYDPTRNDGNIRAHLLSGLPSTAILDGKKNSTAEGIAVERLPISFVYRLHPRAFATD